MKLNINNQKKAGFTLVEIMIVVAIIGLLAAIAIPNFVKARTTAQTNACIANLKQLDGAAQQWALENKKSGTDSVSAALVTDYLKGNKVPNCPAGGNYSAAFTVSGAPACSVGGAHTL